VEADEGQEYNEYNGMMYVTKDGGGMYTRPEIGMG
jgi:hypothetical protein